MFVIPSLLLIGSVELSDSNLSTPEPYGEFHSNLGAQNLVEDIRADVWVGPTPQELAANVMPLGSLSRLSIRQNPKISRKELVKVPPVPKPDSPEKKRYENWVGVVPRQIHPGVMALGSMNDFQYQYRERLDMKLALQASSRPYWTNNALRLSKDEYDSWIWENSISGNLESEPVFKNKFISLIPSLDLNLQFAEYQEKLFKDLLSYRYLSTRLGLRMEFSNDLTIGFASEYSVLHGLNEGEKMFDAVSPSLSVSKFSSLNDQTFLFASASLKYAFTEREINFQAEGVFPDDGDNLQCNTGLSLIRILDEEGHFRLMSGLGLVLSRYLKNEHKGRVDFTSTLSASLGWYPTDWFGAELSSSYTIFSSNSKGDSLLGDSSEYQAADLGISLSAFKSF